MARVSKANKLPNSKCVHPVPFFGAYDLKPIFYDSLVIGCICSDIGLTLFLINEVAFLGLNILFLFAIPIIIFAVTLVVSQRKALFPRKLPQDQLLQTAAMVEQESLLPEVAELGEKKPFKPSATSKAHVEFEMHNCPEHGPERCAGNYMNLHSCNFASPNAKQVYWEEKKPGSANKQKKVNNTAVL